MLKNSCKDYESKTPSVGFFLVHVITLVIFVRYMGRLQRKYEKVEQLDPRAVPVQVYADRIKRSRVYIYVHYDRFKNGFEKDDKHYYSKNPGYRIVSYHGNCYVIPNE